VLLHMRRRGPHLAHKNCIAVTHRSLDNLSNVINCHLCRRKIEQLLWLRRQTW
jgi:hypothetical protein